MYQTETCFKRSIVSNATCVKRARCFVSSMTQSSMFLHFVQMMSAAGGEPMLRRVKQEAEPPPQYSPDPHTDHPLHRSGHMVHAPQFSTIQQLELEPKEEVKFCVSPESGAGGNASPEQQHCSSTTAAAAARDEDSPRRFCLVCGDVASGFHYGVASCEACKAFFKRTIQMLNYQGNIDYTCPASNECEINKRRRKACQACRFRKCLSTGMLREGVRLDRVRGGRQKYRRAPDLPPPAHKPHIDDIKILEALSSYEPELLSCGAAPAGVTEPAARTLALLADLYDRELVGVIGWAKQIPGFTELQLNDQMRLLQSTWAEMLSLMVAYRSLPAPAAAVPASPAPAPAPAPLRLRFAHDLVLDEHTARDIGALDLYLQISGVARRLERLGAQREECYLLKALVLANSEARLDEHAAQRRFRDAILAALNDAVNALRPYNANTALQQLLLSLPALRHADVAVRRFWAGVHRDRRTHMNKLFVEMLEACLR
ncbi:PREDICTED: steroid hormone receptor ERR1-like isoform X3 [Papilio polytes]|uniref:steroid hormone receptor ERR1-like isoform X3 n=1 Tax=Papilio polytes TaxID=76194 RepID=UPI0006767F03|nr:PREDICTED: steroid hormone receptor ERR1-like isoform X3 [Papilio polytes]